jgi:hypothetical protein
MKLTQFRLQRGSLEESLKTTVNVSSIQDILIHLRSTYDESTKDYFDMIQEQWQIKISNNMIFDPRCNWNTKTVSLNGHGVGFARFEENS